MADASAFTRSSRDEVLEAVGSTRMNDDDFVPNVSGNFKRAASFRQSIRGRRLPGGSASPAGVRRTPSMRTNNTTGSAGTNTTLSSSPAATNNLDDISDEIGEDAVAEEFFSQLSQMKDSIAAMTQSQAEKELHAKAGEQRLMQENGRLQERCASLEMQYADLERHYQQLMQKEVEHYKQMQSRAEHDRDFMQAKWEEEKQQLKESLAVAQRNNADVKRQLELDKAELERLRMEKPWLEEKAVREAAQFRETLQEVERLRKELQESKQEQDQLDASYHDEIKALQSQIADLSYSSSSGDHEREHLIGELKSEVDRLRQENGDLREQNTELHLASTATISTNRTLPVSDSLASQLAEAAIQGGYAGKLLGYQNGSSRGGSRSNSMDSDVMMKQQRDELRNRPTTCEVCKKKDEEFFRVQSYLQTLVQRVIDTHPEILEIRNSTNAFPPAPTITTTSISKNSSPSKAAQRPFVDTAAATNPFEEEEPTNPFEDEEVVTTTTTTTYNNNSKNAGLNNSSSERMQVDEDEVTVAPPPRAAGAARVFNNNNNSARPVTPVAAAFPPAQQQQQQQQKRNGLQKPRAPRAPPVAAVTRNAQSQQPLRSRQSGAAPASEC